MKALILAILLFAVPAFAADDRYVSVNFEKADNGYVARINVWKPADNSTARYVFTATTIDQAQAMVNAWFDAYQTTGFWN